MWKFNTACIVLASAYAFMAPALAGTTQLSSPTSGPSGIVQQQSQPSSLASPSTFAPTTQAPTSQAPTSHAPTTTSPTTLAPTPSNSSMPVLREHITVGPQALDTQPGSIESFFQISPLPGERSGSATDPSASANVIESARARRQPAQSERKSFGHSASRFTWHVLDNLGVPMFYGNHEEYLDPSIARRNIHPSEAPPKAHTHIISAKVKRAPIDATIARPNSNESDSRLQPPDAIAPTRPATVHRIPESELEGTDVISPPNEKPSTP